MAARCTTRWKPAVGFGSPARSVLIEEFGQILFNLLDIHTAGAQHRERIRVIDQPEQQMLEGRIFVLAIGGELQRPVQSLFKIARQHGSSSFTPQDGALSSGLKSGLPGRL
jgi:hypothetical protein